MAQASGLRSALMVCSLADVWRPVSGQIPLTLAYDCETAAARAGNDLIAAVVA